MLFFQRKGEHTHKKTAKYSCLPVIFRQQSCITVFFSISRQCSMKRIGNRPKISVSSLISRKMVWIYVWSTQIDVLWNRGPTSRIHQRNEYYWNMLFFIVSVSFLVYIFWINKLCVWILRYDKVCKQYHLEWPRKQVNRPYEAEENI